MTIALASMPVSLLPRLAEVIDLIDKLLLARLEIKTIE
jgi:hypothetical protein